MLKLSHLSLRRGKRELLHGANLVVHQGQRVGVTGANGTGKSSLFALIRGQLQADEGELLLPQSLEIAHVAQETPAVDKSALDYVMDGDQGLRAIEGKIAQARDQNRGEELARYYAEYEAIDGYSAASRAGRLMHGLGFTDAQEQAPVKSFSGGWRMRLNLAQALMCRSDLLLLDEPTNHLDLEAVIWLEDWLRAYAGTLLLISHDRDFLDRVVTHIAHIEQQQLSLYTGTYSEFEVRRAQQLANQQAAYEKQQREMARMQQFVDRFRAKATKARQAQSRIKALQRMELISQAHVDSPFDFHFAQAAKMPHTLVRLEHARAGYGDKTILTNVNLQIHPGERIGLLGYNGAGKSTLIKLLAGELAPQQGQRELAKDLEIGYFAQHQLEQLDANASPLLHLQRLDAKAGEQQLRDFLGGFAFSGDMAASAVAPFSGGEKARLVLAMIVYQRPNLLLLDEPTNHLDLEMRHALNTALQEFEGAVILVSHDRHLLRTVSDSLLLVANGSVNEFKGDLDDYRQWVKSQEQGQTSPAEPGESESGEAGSANRRQQRQQAAQKRQQLQPLRNKLKKLEQQLEQLNKQHAQIQQQLADNSIYDAANKDRLTQLLAEQGKLTPQIQQLEEEWLLLSEELESLS